MPIDFEALVAPFRTAYFLQWRSITESMQNIALWLSKRIKATVERERESRGLQTFSFVGDAVSLWIDTAQHGSLGPVTEAPPAGLWGNVAAPFQRLWRGLLLARTMVQAEGVLPGILGALADTVNMITESLDRFKTADKSLFDVSARQGWKDLFGEIGLFFRLANRPSTVKQVERLSEGGIELIGVYRKHFPPAPKTAKGESAGGLPELTRTLTGAILGLPLIWQFLSNMASTVSLAIRLELLKRLGAVQSDVFQLRRDLIDFMFGTLNGIALLALETLLVARFDAQYTIELYLSFIKAYFQEIQDWLTVTGKELKSFLDGFVSFLYILGDYLDKFMDINLGKALTEGIVSFTPSDLLDPAKVKALQRKIDLALAAARKIARTISPLGGAIGEALIQKRLKALREVLGSVGTPPQIPAEAAPPDLSSISAPDIYESFFGGTQAAKLRSTLAEAGSTLAKSFDEIFDAGITALSTTAETFGKAATDAAHLGAPARYGLVATRAAALAEKAFGADSALVRRKDPVAAAFESWISHSGFNLIGKVLPAYVAEMIAFWKKEARKGAADRPTSPAILARRARLDRVRLPRLVIRINEERELDKTLAAEIADLVRQGVARAFGTAMAQPEGAG